MDSSQGDGRSVAQPSSYGLNVRLPKTVLDLRVGDPGQPLLSLERLYVDLGLASLWQRAWVFKVVRINGPFARAIIHPEGSLNLVDLVPERPADAVDDALPAVWIQRLLVARGKVSIELGLE